MAPVTAEASAKVSESSKAYEPDFGAARPPIGFVRFCAENADSCARQGLITTRHAAMDPDRWNLLYQVNTYVNGKIKPESDQQLYGEPERWVIPVAAGDCEDFMLLKQKYLVGLGFPLASLLATVVLDEKGEGHAVLTVSTSDGDFILDNRNNEILRWNDTPYTFLKRQSPQDPKQWVALQKEKSLLPSDVAVSEGP
ncbi:MAG: transglutaminase-like cysteine peptidase [Hyphomicrobiales bacterium]